MWLPYTAAPDLLSFLRYQHQGMSFIQSVLAYQILADQTGNTQGMFHMLYQPMATDTSVFDPLE